MIIVLIGWVRLQFGGRNREVAELSGGRLPGWFDVINTEVHGTTTVNSSDSCSSINA